WTLTDRIRRVDVRVRVAYGSDPERVLQILLDTARQSERVIPLPEAVAQFLGFGDSSLDFILQAWIARHEQSGAITSGLALAVYRALRDAGIEIPVPQRDVRVHLGPGAEPDQG